MCSSRDLFVLENRIIQLFRGIFLISMPHKVNLIGINIFKSHIVEFSKNLENSDFCLKNLPVEKIRMFDVFPSRMAPLMTLVPHFNNTDFCTFTQNTRLVKENYF